MEQPKRHSLSMRVFPPLALWTINKILAAPPVKERTKRLDARAHRKKEQALKALGKAGDHALSNPGWLAAGLATVAVGIGLLTRATRK